MPTGGKDGYNMGAHIFLSSSFTASLDGIYIGEMTCKKMVTLLSHSAVVLVQFVAPHCCFKVYKNT